ncbi:tetraspanin-4 isoform X4 [Pteropus medius]|uniref:Tetraspanin-4 n=1 Tax=Pteropus vampyrus TaxID=132908 RepID=A0A6P6BX89_PTEVA|nr:tetraspanin-4 isoform X4 [Pteropus vampyrus]XP_023379510.1 tetraspanin-4 isoform X5 [Pteropus vampyrus]XP_039696451.1 tetraspanin-4 isoform X4 [Pteropus giganteus]
MPARRPLGALSPPGSTLPGSALPRLDPTTPGKPQRAPATLAVCTAHPLAHRQGHRAPPLSPCEPRAEALRHGARLPPGRQVPHVRLQPPVLAGRLRHPGGRHLAGRHAGELRHPVLLLPFPVGRQSAHRHRHPGHGHRLRGLHRGHQGEQFFVMLLLVFLLEATVTILFFAYTDKIDRYAQRDLKKGLHLYGTPGNVGLTNAWSIIQTDFRCCGVANYTDWFEVYNATRVPDSCCLEFSESCGLHAPGTWWKAPCYQTVKMWLQENLLAVGVFGLCTALVQILGLTFAMTMYCQVVKADTYCA